MAEPFYNPLYPENLVPGYENKQLPVTLIKDGKRYEAYITNFSSSGFFCCLSGPLPKGLRGSLEVEAKINETQFFYNGKLVTRNQNGVGVRITANPIPHVGWNSFYGIIKELGYRPS